MRKRWLPHNGAMRPLSKGQTFGRCQGSTEYTDKLISTQRGTEQAVAVQEAKPDDVKATSWCRAAINWKQQSQNKTSVKRENAHHLTMRLDYLGCLGHAVIGAPFERTLQSHC